jgi:putative thioredoxin
MSFDVQNFDRDVIERSRSVPVLVDFWAPWCGPCKMLAPILERLASEANGRWALVKVNTEEHPGLAEAFRISSIPNVKLFRDGVVADEFLGALPEVEIRKWIARHVPSPADVQLESAAEKIDEGDLAGARLILEQTLAADPHRAAAKLLLAEIVLGEDPVKACAVLDEIPLDADEATHAQALKFLATATQRTAESLPDGEPRARLAEGLAAIRQRDWETALTAFIDVIEQRRSYADDLAASCAKAIVRYLGVRHPIVDKHYRRLSGALNA